MLRIEEPEGLFSFRHEAMATDFVLALGGVDERYGQGVAHEAFRIVDDVESKLSLYRESSDVSRINLAAVGETVAVSATCSECLRLALEASRITEDRFQVFTGRAACLAKGFIPPFLEAKMKALESDGGTGGAAIALDPRTRQATKLRDDVILDLGGIGKGFALDEVVELLEDWDVPVASLNSGGSTHLFRSELESTVWRVELGARFLGALRDGALASSGLGFQERHIIDPRTGASTTRWRRSFVHAPSAGIADALSTAAMLMEWEALRDLARRGSALSFAVELQEGSTRRCGRFFCPEDGR